MHYYGANSYRNKNIEIWTNAIFDVVKENCLNMYWYRCFHFHLNGAVNNHNKKFWDSSPPEEIVEKQLKGKKVTAFVAFNAEHGLLGPYWFEVDGKTATINAERYRDVVRSFHNDLRGILSHRQLRQAWYQQDGAPPHTAHGTIRYLKELFPGRLIALKSDVEWAPHSPDLNPLDFWLWGAAKDEVYKARPRTLEALKRQVTEYVQQVPLATCRKVGDNFKVRVAACRRRRGGHIEHISYHKLAGF